MPKETGIIMSGSHPVDILEGRKTMTRRTWGLEKINKDPDLWEKPFYDEVTGYWNFWQVNTGEVLSAKCPYGGVGDWLWVRETIYRDLNDAWCYKADDTPIKEGDYKKGEYFDGDDTTPRPSIFMPLWASRIIREITQLGAERLQEITEEDAIAEGCRLIARTIQPFELKPSPHFTAPERPFTHRDHFIGLWDSLNAKRGYGWDKNPWVWPIRFGMIK